MNLYRKWVFVVLALVVFLFTCRVLINYVIDPHGIFRNNFAYQFTEPDRDFIKTRYVTEHPDRYRCFVFGSSRINRIDVRSIKDENCYSMGYSGGSPSRHASNLRYFLKKGVAVRTVLLGLDNFYHRPQSIEYHTLSYKHPYPPSIGERVLPYYARYLLSSVDDDEWKTFYRGCMDKWRGLEKNVTEYDLFNTGHSFNPGVDIWIEANPEKHAMDPRFTNVQPGITDDLLLSLEDIREIVQLTNRHGIRLIVFINPIYQSAYLRTEIKTFLRFKRELSRIVDFYDFSGLNSITTNNYYYYESSHFRPKVGDMMIARMFQDKSVFVPADFGVYVTAANAGGHLERQRRELDNR